jgi:hypothetical protein
MDDDIDDKNYARCDEIQQAVVKHICFETGSVKDLHNLLYENPKIDLTKMKFVS